MPWFPALLIQITAQQLFVYHFAEGILCTACEWACASPCRATMPQYYQLFAWKLAVCLFCTYRTASSFACRGSTGCRIFWIASSEASHRPWAPSSPQVSVFVSNSANCSSIICFPKRPPPWSHYWLHPQIPKFVNFPNLVALLWIPPQYWERQIAWRALRLLVLVFVGRLGGSEGVSAGLMAHPMVENPIE